MHKHTREGGDLAMLEAKTIHLHEIKHSHFFESYFESGTRRVQSKELDPTDRHEIFPPWSQSRERCA